MTKGHTSNVPPPHLTRDIVYDTRNGSIRKSQRGFDARGATQGGGQDVRSAVQGSMYENRASSLDGTSSSSRTLAQGSYESRGPPQGTGNWNNVKSAPGNYNNPATSKGSYANRKSVGNQLAHDDVMAPKFAYRDKRQPTLDKMEIEERRAGSREKYLICDPMKS